ncbi:MAG: hypothetical protein LQ343_003077 [Gyalolechia ehrenbergii]|nr:MAG: hypothetical protein LQ343_003077 [Gyalolechia ehrenbergii]
MNGLDPAVEESLAEVKFVQASFISWLALYGASVALSKGAILLLYLRVFTTNNRWFTIAVRVIGFFVSATGITTIVGSIFQCTPIARNWDQNLPGKCIDKLDFSRYIAIPNVITGLAMLVLPLPMVWRLNVTIQQKVALTATFLHGIIVANLDMDACRAQQFDHRSLSTYLEADLDFDIATFLLPSDKQTQK